MSEPFDIRQFPELPPEVVKAFEAQQFELAVERAAELLSNLVFESCRSCGDLACFGGFDPVFERNAGDNFGESVKAA